MLDDLLQRPLITGASVSAGYGAASPGVQLALRFTKRDQIRVIAQNGKPGREVVRNLTHELVQDRTAIIAIDFLFWDSTLANPGQSERALLQLIALARHANVPLIIGDVPNLLPGFQPHRQLLNEYLYNQCRLGEHCGIVGLDQIHRSIMRDGFLEIDDREFPIYELVPDGLHLSTVASDYLADRIGDALIEAALKEHKADRIQFPRNVDL